MTANFINVLKGVDMLKKIFFCLFSLVSVCPLVSGMEVDTEMEKDGSAPKGFSFEELLAVRNDDSDGGVLNLSFKRKVRMRLRWCALFNGVRETFPFGCKKQKKDAFCGMKRIEIVKNPFTDDPKVRDVFWCENSGLAFFPCDGERCRLFLYVGTRRQSTVNKVFEMLKDEYFPERVIDRLKEQGVPKKKWPNPGHSYKEEKIWCHMHMSPIQLTGNMGSASAFRGNTLDFYCTSAFVEVEDLNAKTTLLSHTTTNYGIEKGLHFNDWDDEVKGFAGTFYSGYQMTEMKRYAMFEKQEEPASSSAGICDYVLRFLESVCPQCEE